MTSCGELEDKEEVGSPPGAPQPTTFLLSLLEEWEKAQPWHSLCSPEFP